MNTLKKLAMIGTLGLTSCCEINPYSVHHQKKFQKAEELIIYLDKASKIFSGSVETIKQERENFVKDNLKNYNDDKKATNVGYFLSVIDSNKDNRITDHETKLWAEKLMQNTEKKLYGTNEIIVPKRRFHF